ncbi:hypothetical protein ACWGCW_21915 [Streptomyces sp. NPDC054933]
MGQGSAKNEVGTGYIGDVFMRHPLTTRNQEELDIAAKADAILKRHQRSELKRTPKEGENRSAPSASP